MEGYRGYRLPDLWKMVEGEDPETGFAHVNNLNRLRTAVEQQRANLRAHRDRLVEGWPPEHSEAAAAFVWRINGMIDQMAQTADAASRICTGVDEVFAAIRDARRQLESLMAAHSSRRGNRGPALPDAEDLALDQRARAVLLAVDARVAEAFPMLAASVPAFSKFDMQGTALSGDDSSLGSSTEGSSSGGGGGGRLASLPPPVFQLPEPTAQQGTEARDGDEPILVSDDGAYLRQPGPNPTGLIGVGPRYDGPAMPVRVGVMPPGGVIGQPGGADALGDRFAGPPTTGIPPRPFPAPAGQREVTGLGGAGRSAEEAMPGQYRDRSYEHYTERRRSRRSREDEVWPVADGVSPVLEAPVDRPHEPGPGVLGIDR